MGAETTEGSGLRLIIAYKLAKAVAQLVLAGVLLLMLSRGLADRIHALVVRWEHHVTQAWSVALVRLLVRSADARHEHVLLFALAGDGVLSALEGWALHRRYRWAPWVVAAFTGTPLPFELARLVVRPGLGRAMLLVANALVFGYLVRHARGKTAP